MTKLFYNLRLLLLFLLSCGLHYDILAQVTIGDGTPPQEFSILEISSQNTKGGIRLPHLTTAERDALNSSNVQFQAEMGRIVNDPLLGLRPGQALGLTIYNTDTECVEYWDGYKWVSLCLGTAEIKLKENCNGSIKYYDPEHPPVTNADGTISDCSYIPEEIPACTVTSGEAYQIYIAAGSSYANLLRDDFTSSFNIRFDSNNTNRPRNAVVRIVNNCTGEFKDFIFTQEGAPCSSTTNVTLNTSTVKLCVGGSAFVHVQNPTVVDYVWTYGDAIVHTGTWYEIKRAGVYTVYPGLVGCGTPANLTVSQDPALAPSSLIISATNGGILCAGGNVMLTAANATSVQWYHNGIPDGTANPLPVTGADMAGMWFAVATDVAGCNSISSNIINLHDNTIGSIALTTPEMLIDGNLVTPLSTLSLCEGSGVVLDVNNASVYTPGTMFEWFVNGNSIGASASPQKDYTVPAGATNLIIAVQVSNSGIDCPNTSVSPNVVISSIAPNRTTINNGQANGYVCGASSAILTAAYQGGTEYEWRRDGVKITGAGTFQYNTNDLGVYTVRYKDAGDCWSRFSPAITVINSSPITMFWELEPSPTAIYGDNKTYSVKTAPIADNYVWTAIGTVSGVIPMYPSGNGSMATITYPILTTPLHEDITITVTANNGCGTTALPPKVVDLGSGCIPVTSVNINPPGKSTIYIPGSLIFTATSQVGANYTWYLDGSEVQPRSTLHTYTYTVPINAAPAPHTLSVTADGCTGQATASVDVVVMPKLNEIPEYTGKNAFFAGQVCFDVNKTTTPTCGDTNGRIDAFAETKSFNYTLSPEGSATLSDIVFAVEDDSKLLDVTTPYSVNDKILTLNFRSDIRDYIAGNGDASITLYAVFKISGVSGFQRLSLHPNIKDCSCCGAFIRPAAGAAIRWKAFQCHNLGADTSKKPNVPSREIAGDYYKWGLKSPSATSSSGAGVISGWSLSSYPSKPWNQPENNPCPTGFRIPTEAEWMSVVELSKMNPKTPLGNWGPDSDNFTAGIYLGSNLFLPINGYRSESNGALRDRGVTGLYWSSKAVDTNSGYPYYTVSYKTASSLFITTTFTAIADTENTIRGSSVRCIAED